jgi:methionyl aminopeptidase
VSIENEEQLAGLKHIGRIVGLTLQLMKNHVRVGISTAELDAIGADFLAQHSANSAPMLSVNFPAITCISLNDEAAHGIPTHRLIQAGDLVKIDVSAECDGYFADAALTVMVAPIHPDKKRLVDCARQALDKAILAAKAGHPVNRIGHAAEQVARNMGYQIIPDLTGHGVGSALWEEPTVPNNYLPHYRTRMHKGMVLAVEPHVTMGRGRIKTLNDGWTIRTTDRKLVANFEHTIVVTEHQPILLTAV